jgi:hypothetical protein
MRKVEIILLLVLLVCGAGLVLISLPVAEGVTNLTFTLDDGTTGMLEITAPRYFRMGDKANLQLEVTLIPGGVSASGESVKIKSSLQSATLEMNPSTAVTTVIPTEGTGRFLWEITGHASEAQRATLWCFRLGAARPELILARDLSFEVKTILGMRFRLFRWILAEVMLLCTLLIGVTIFRTLRR